MANKRITRSNPVRELSTRQLRWTCPTSKFKFNSTKSLESLKEIVGQPRAVESIQLGAKLFSPGYNIFVSGLSGTGRLTTVKKLLEAVRSTKNFTFDYCYVHNFKNSDEPRLLKFSRGMGQAFCKSMAETIAFLRTRIPQLFEEEGFQKTRRALVIKFQQKEKEVLTNFDAKLRPNGFFLTQSENDDGVIQYELLFKLKDENHSIEDLRELVNQGVITEAQAKKINTAYQHFADEFADIARERIRIVQEFQRELKEHDRLAATLIVKSAVDDIRSNFNDEEPRVLEHLDTVYNHVLDNLPAFHPEHNLMMPIPSETGEEDPFDVYRVNVVMDNTDTEGGPIIIETNPTLTNLFGTIERKFDRRGFWKTDFMHIKGGSLLQADGGYLILNALDMLAEQGVWKALKRVLLHSKLHIQASDSYFQLSQIAVKPEPIKINVKIVMIGDEDIYRLLYFEEEDFRKMFKINANFDYEAELTDEMMQNYASLTHKICEEEGLRHFNKTGMAALIEFGVTHAGSRGHISLRFSDVADVVREASYYARQTDAKTVGRDHVEEALKQRKWRDNLLDEKLHNAIIEGTFLIDTDGDRVGQINGLSVYSTGLVSFGKPIRITSSIGVGSAGIVNIEREVELSGSSHDKGILILSGFLRERFATSAPVSLSASIAFEQSYDEIDGDSASSTEIYAMLSSLADVPIRQYIAVTGSVNQKGDIQPIGGVNEKIEGFFQVCAARGLDGRHGVIIPEQNIKNLMLPQDVIEAVKNKQFHIWAVSTIEQGIELLTGMPAGTPTDIRKFNPDTIYGRVAQTLEDYRQAMKEHAGDDPI